MSTKYCVAITDPTSPHYGYVVGANGCGPIVIFETLEADHIGLVAGMIGLVADISRQAQ